MVSLNYESIPAYLKEHARFCLWKYEERIDGGGNPYLTKAPYQPKNPQWGAKSTDPNTFTDYETARAAFVGLHGFDGLGVGVFDGVSGIDIDHCITGGELSPMAREIVEAMETYTEVSPSGEGLRLFFLARGYEYDVERYYINSKSAGDKAKAAHPYASYIGGEGLEVYVSGNTNKYMTITGNVLEGCTYGIEERGDRLQPILEKFMRRKPENPNPKGESGVKSGFKELFPERLANYEQHARGAARTPDDLTDDELLAAISESKSAGEFFSLWNGDTGAYATVGKNGHRNDGRSEADLALCNHLAFWTGCNSQRMDSLFRQSGLMRDKWDERRGGDTYGGMTIEKAIRDCHETYTPSKIERVEAEQPTDEAEAQEDETIGKFISERPADVAQKIIDCKYEETPIKTGFESLDTALYGGLRSGLITIGAISSAGKTTLLNQIGDYVAAHDTPVLFCSIEQTARELVGKSLSRMMAQRGYKGMSLYAIEDSKSRYSDIFKEQALTECLEEYKETIAPNITIMTARREWPTVQDIELVASKVANRYGKSPLVIVDYLQLIAPIDSRMSDKQATDVNVSRLRLLATNRLKTPVIVISSLNRASYNTGIERSSFKESGMVEYSSDVLLGLQPHKMREIINDKVKGRDGDMKPPSDAIKAIRSDNLLDGFMKGAIKECELVFLKHRNGKMPSEPLPFTFFAASSFFVEGNAFEESPGDVGRWLESKRVSG